LHRTGERSLAANEFSATNWIEATSRYLNKIKDLTNNEWTNIFGALYRYQELCAAEAKIRAGAILDDDEPLLPADPPSPPA
jgi:hypothetical protein